MKQVFEWLGRQPWIPAVAAPIDRAAYRVLGRGLAVGVPTLLLHHTGRQTGEIRKSPLFYLEDGSDYVVMATNYGRAEPDWSLNLRQRPDVTLEVGRVVGPYRAQIEADSGRREVYWQDFIEMYSNYETYRKNAGREVPVWVLSPR